MYKALTGPVIKEAREGIARGEIRAGVDPELLAFALTGLIEVLSFRISLDNKYTIEDAIHFIGDFMINGLVPPSMRERWDISVRLIFAPETGPVPRPRQPKLY